MVNIGGTQEKCTACTKTVYLTEKIVVEDKEERKTFHKLCLKCSHCKLTLSLGNYASMNGIFFCKPHFKQLFATKGNYDEGFGKTKHSEKWTPQAAPTGTGSFIKVEETSKTLTQEKKETPTAISSKFSGSTEKCHICTKTVYLTEKIVVEDKEDRKVLHKQCLKCTHCSVTLNLGTYASMNGVFYCKPHFKQLFATKGNYDEGFGNTKSDKWTPQASTAPSSFIPLEKTSTAEKNTNQSANPDIAKKFSTGGAEKCHDCQKSVYLTEKVVLEETDNKRIFHKACLKCSKCSVILTLGTLVQLDGVIFCKPHFKELYATQGNLDGGFGKPKHNEKWDNNPYPYLEKNETYVPSVQAVEEQIQGNNVESDVERFRNINRDDSDKPRRNEPAPVVVEEEQKTEEPVTEEQEQEKVEEPVTEEQEKVEEPVTEEKEEEPVTEEKVEEPVVAEQEEQTVEEPVIAEQEQQEEEQKVEEPIVSEPIAVEEN